MGALFLLPTRVLLLLIMAIKKEFEEYELLEVSKKEWDALPLLDRWIMHYENRVRTFINSANRSILFKKQMASLWKKIVKIKIAEYEKPAFNSLKYAMEQRSQIDFPEGYVNQINDFHEIKNTDNFFKLNKVDDYYQYERVKRDEINVL